MTKKTRFSRARIFAYLKEKEQEFAREAEKCSQEGTKRYFRTKRMTIHDIIVVVERM